MIPVISVATMIIALPLHAGSFDDIEHTQRTDYLPFSQFTGSDCEDQTMEFPQIGRMDVADTVPWTVLLYDDADFYQGYDPIYSFADDMRSSDSINVVILQDQYQNPAFIYRVLANGDLDELESLGEVNMASPATLKCLISYGQTYYPAERYFLAVYDHGGGWHGSCIDYSAGTDMLRIDEMQQVMECVQEIDILAFTAPCLMGSLESVYEMRDQVDVYIGAEDLSGYIYWDYAMNDISVLLENSSSLSNVDIGNQIIEIIESNSSSYEWLTMSATNCSLTDLIAQEINELALYLAEHIESEGPFINEVRAQVQEMGEVSTYSYMEIDLGNFLDLYISVTEDQLVVTHLQTCQTLLNQAVINECHSDTLGGMTGLSIMFPAENEYNELLRYKTWNVDFPDNTNWDEFLDAYYDWLASGIAWDNEEGVLTLQPSCNPVATWVDLHVYGQISQGASLNIYDAFGRIVYSSNEIIGNMFRWHCTGRSGHQIPIGVYNAVVTTSAGTSTSLRLMYLGSND